MNIPEQRGGEPIIVLGFPDYDWPVIQAAAQERINKRKAAFFEPLAMDKALAETEGPKRGIECEVRDSARDVGKLLQEYSDNTQDAVAQLSDPKAINERRRGGAVALLLARQMESAVTANEAAQNLDAELAEFFGAT